MAFDWWGGEEDLRRVGRIIYYMKKIFSIIFQSTDQITLQMNPIVKCYIQYKFIAIASFLSIGN